MIISSSGIAMSSNHHAASYSHVESMSIKAAASDNVSGAILTLSHETEGKSYLEDMKTYEKQKKEDTARQKEEQEKRALSRMAEHLQKAGKTSRRVEMSDETKLKIALLKKMFALLNRRETRELDREISRLESKAAGSSIWGENVLDLRSSQSFSEVHVKEQTGKALSIGTTRNGTVWQQITATSGFQTEVETTTFATKGLVQTADGRTIDFNLEVGMSRAFTSKIDKLTVKDYVMTDPLMINLDTNVGTVTDQKFLFDLDADGKEENISFAGRGSGFLALDKNNDGKINDGSELFGTKSGDGFSDLASYDEDGNGWIDENDTVFSQLRVWTKDEDGRDVLMDLKEADVGAIYLGHTDTEFTLKDDANRTNGALRQTGIYLKESSGEAGTINHVDLAL